MENNIKKISITLKNSKYDINIGHNLLSYTNKYFNLNRKTLIITDDNIPESYIKDVSSNINDFVVFTMKNGEENKSFDNYKQILKVLIENSFTRTDCIIALGGGVIGDLAGFVACTFMRGIDFYNIPTTLLSQVDSSIGGKTAIDFLSVKNIIGGFFQPKGVLIDVDTLKSLPDRQLKNGLVESIKMAATFDKKFFDYLYTKSNIVENAEEIIYRSLLLKKDVVEKDEKEQNLRKVLNFGHTLGHAIEETMNLTLLHGECVGIGMLYFSSDEVKKSIKDMLEKYGLPTSCEFDKNKVLDLIKHDKKASGNTISTVQVKKIGTYEIVKMTLSEIATLLNNYNYQLFL